MKTSQELAVEWYIRLLREEPAIAIKEAYQAGYRAAKDEKAAQQKQAEDRMREYEEMVHEEVDKIIAEYGLPTADEKLRRCLCIAFMNGIDSVDGYLRNSLSAYRTAIRQMRWIPITERLPKQEEYVVIYDRGQFDTSYLTVWGHWAIKQQEIMPQPSHWFALPEPPKDEK